MAKEVQHLRVTYNDIHNLIRRRTPEIAKAYNPDLLIAIGGGGFFPARVMRTFLREETQNKTLQIQAIGLSLYEPVDGTSVEQLGNEVIRTQWLDDSGKMLLGRRNLIVDEVDDTRKTLRYAVSELKRDVEAELLKHPEDKRAKLRAATRFAIFVVHNKKKPKLAEIDPETLYFSGDDVEDVWLDYPWEATNIEEHDRLAAQDRQ
ncbi:PRTase-like protein [Coprinopsis marcescibilis]|uniref:PRTase-like protein n=1 Tax=Coprinopsis marcescibilis TaxID=230819 RepID=A0A5C3KYE1_COPMA|nr:PRTase-like protein [Coprinopsis marcescibilis]